MKFKFSISSVFFVILLLELIYFNIAYDFILVLFLFLTSYSVGTFFKINLSFIDRFFVRISLGLGIVGFLIWLSTFYNINYKSTFLILSIFIITVRFKNIYEDLRILVQSVNKINKRNVLFFPVILIFFIFYLIVASYPLFIFDTLSYNIAVPVKILNSSHYDYNVIEQVGFGNYAILPHMHFTYLMGLGGTKAITIFSVFISFLTCLMIVRIAMKIYKSSLYANLIILIFFSTPYFYHLSTTLYVDIFGVYFIVSSLIIFIYLKTDRIFNNLNIAGFLLGCSFFAKQQAAYFIMPLALLILIYLIVSLIKKEFSFGKILLRGITTLVLFLLPFLPIMMIIWHKTGNPIFPFMNQYFNSPYFDKSYIIDPFSSSPLGLNIKSIFSIVFSTKNNMEIDSGCLGYYLLAIFGVPAVFIFNRKKQLIFILSLMLIGYIIATQANYNLRYMLGTFILAIPICILLPVIIFDFIKLSKLKNIIFYLLAIILIIPNVMFLFDKGKSFMFLPKMLIPDSRLTIAENQDILAGINNRDVYLLSNNDAFRTDYKGKYYTLTWFNQYLLTKLENGEISVNNFLNSFDYYLVSKLNPLEYEQMFSLKNENIAKSLELYNETWSHYLYRVKKEIKRKEFLLAEETFQSPVQVSEYNNRSRRLNKNFDALKIEIEAEKINADDEAFGRFQVNWYDKDVKMLDVMMIPYKLEPYRKKYVSELIINIPEKASFGVVFLAANKDNIPIQIHSYKVYAYKNESAPNLLKWELFEYGRKWPYLAE